MIQVIDKSNMHRFGDLVRSFSALRHEVFIKQLGWDIPCREPGFEEDQFDDEHAIYLLVTENERVVAGARLLDTARRSLLGEVFPDLVDGPAPADARVFEVTRFLAPRGLTADGGSRCTELLWGLQAYGLWAGLTHLVSVSYLSLEPILRRAGYQFQRLGAVREADGARIAALRHEVSEAVLNQTSRRLSGSVTFAPAVAPVPCSDAGLPGLQAIGLRAEPRQQAAA